MIQQCDAAETCIAVPQTDQFSRVSGYDGLKRRLRQLLCEQARRGTPLTYESIASKLPELGRDSMLVRRLLEDLMEEDARAGRPFVSAVAIGSSGRGLPGPWFFLKAEMLGRLNRQPTDLEAFAFHAAELHHCSTYHLSLGQSTMPDLKRSRISRDSAAIVPETASTMAKVAWDDLTHHEKTALKRLNRGPYPDLADETGARLIGLGLAVARPAGIGISRAGRELVIDTLLQARLSDSDRS